MRKFLNFKFVAASLIAAAFTLSSCQKEQEPADESANSGRDESKISSQAVNGTNIRGLISKETAERMAETFNQAYKTKNGTEYVAFAVNDMSNYLLQLKEKYKSDSVYVSFGVYDAKTAVNKADIGRITVFFMGKNNNKSTGNIRSQSTEDDGSSNYFNHGSIWP
jgi:hypothetical protein